MNLMNAIPTPAWVAGFKVPTTNCEHCRRSMAVKNISTRKVGIRMGDRWYCSPRCFAAAAEQRLSELLTTRRLDQANRVPRMPLGLSLMSRGLLTKTQLKDAMDLQKETGEEIGEIVVRQGLVSEDQLTAVRASMWGCAVFDVRKHILRARIAIPSALIRQYSAIPLHYVETTRLLLVGFVKGVEYGLLYAIEQVTGCKTQACFVTPTDFEARMREMDQAKNVFGDDSHRGVTFDNIQPPAEMARVLCEYGVDLEAEEATIGKCKERIWARLKCGPRDIDLLFKTV
jgi:hypothetical protein